MATKAEKIALIQKFSPPVDLTGEESIADLDKIIKTKNSVEPAKEEETIEPTGKEKKAKDSITFHLRTYALKERTFSKEVHGDDFNDIADEFHKTNHDKVTKRIHDGKEVEEK